jgi:hypothetical protein
MSYAAPAPDPFVGKVLDNFLGLAGRTVGHVGQTIGHVGQSVGSLFGESITFRGGDEM